MCCRMNAQSQSAPLVGGVFPALSAAVTSPPVSLVHSSALVGAPAHDSTLEVATGGLAGIVVGGLLVWWFLRRR